MASYSTIITSAEVIIAGGQIFKIAASRLVNVSEEEINLMKENAIPRNTKHATKFGMTLFKCNNTVLLHVYYRQSKWPKNKMLSAKVNS